MWEKLFLFHGSMLWGATVNLLLFYREVRWSIRSAFMYVQPGENHFRQENCLRELRILTLGWKWEMLRQKYFLVTSPLVFDSTACFSRWEVIYFDRVRRGTCHRKIMFLCGSWGIMKYLKYLNAFLVLGLWNRGPLVSMPLGPKHLFLTKQHYKKKK